MKKPPEPSEPSVSVASDSLDDAVAQAQAANPGPNEAAIEAAQARAAEAEAAETAPEVGASRKRGPYKKAGKKSDPASKLVQPGDWANVRKLAFRRTGYSIADTIIAGGITLGGEDWRPKTVKDGEQVIFDERHNLREVWADLAEEYQWDRMPAWLACSIVTASYAVPRAFAPSTMTRWAKVKLWLASRKNNKPPTEKTEGE